MGAPLGHGPPPAERPPVVDVPLQVLDLRGWPCAVHIEFNRRRRLAPHLSWRNQLVAQQHVVRRAHANGAHEKVRSGRQHDPIGEVGAHARVFQYFSGPSRKCLGSGRNHGNACFRGSARHATHMFVMDRGIFSMFMPENYWSLEMSSSQMKTSVGNCSSDSLWGHRAYCVCLFFSRCAEAVPTNSSSTSPLPPPPTRRPERKQTQLGWGLVDSKNPRRR